MKALRKRHLRLGELQAYVDEVVSPSERDRAERHLGRCERCARAAAALSEREDLVSSRLRLLGEVQADAGPDPELRSQDIVPQVITPSAARQRLAAYEESRYKEAKMPWVRGTLSRRVSPAWAAVVVVLVLVGSLSLQPVRALAGRFLGLFRVEQIEVVEFSPSALFGEESPEIAMQSLEKLMDEQVNITVSGELQTVDEATLRSLSDFQVRLPEGLSAEPHYQLQPSAEIVVKVDLPRIRALLAELGYADVALPDDLDGAEIGVSLAPSVVAAYGDCEPDAEDWHATNGPGEFAGDCIALMQMVSPDVSAPDGLDVEMLGQAYLQLLGMSPDEAVRFSRQIDWTATLVMPLPRNEVRYEELTVDGSDGVLVRPTHNRLPSDEYFLMWVRDGVVYALTGRGSQAEAQQIANSLQ